MYKGTGRDVADFTLPQVHACDAAINLTWNLAKLLELLPPSNKSLFPWQVLSFWLLQVTVSEGQYNLTADLIRFIVPPSEDRMLVALPGTGASQPPHKPGSHKPKVKSNRLPDVHTWITLHNPCPPQPFAVPQLCT